MIRRELYMNRIRPFIGKDLVKVMTGIRRCGKSVMLQLIQEELLSSGIPKSNIICFNFEDMRNVHLCTAESLHGEIAKRTEGLDGKTYFFLDEIQEVDNWERCVNSLRVEMDCDIYITGSNARLLSGELATVLAGRYVEIVIYPFSLSEFTQLYRTVMPNAGMETVFRQYLTLGGMPYLANLGFEKEPCMQYLTEIYHSIMLNDIVRRNRIRDVDLLTRIINYVIANTGSTFSSPSIVRFLKSEHRSASPETVLNYLQYGADAHLFYRANRQDLTGKQILSTNEKYYMADHGIREAVVGGNQKDINLILENIIYMELRRRGYQVTVGKSGTREIDFIGQKQERRLYIQVAYLLATQETIEREFGIYRTVPDNYPKYVVSMDELDFSRDGIIHRNIRDFLMVEEWD